MASIDLEITGKVAILTINRPAKLNAVTAGMVRMARAHIETIERDVSVTVVVLKGSGEKAFCVGSDLDEMACIRPGELRERTEIPHLLARLSRPVIAMLRGYVLGGGLEIALSCDMRLAGENARLGFPEITHGWLPAGGGGTYRLPRLIGPARALHAILTGRRFTAGEAFDMGLVEEVHPEADLVERTMALAEQIGAVPLELVQAAKEAVSASQATDDAMLARYERALNALCLYRAGRR